MRDQKTNAHQKTMRQYPPAVPPPTPCNESITPYLSHPPIIHNNNTIDTEFMVEMRESNKCGSVMNDEIFNLHLGSGAGP